jgi:hypothetical protein
VTDRKPLDDMTSDDLDQLHDQLDALRAVARGYCPACGRGDAAPTVTDWEQQKQRADQAEADQKAWEDTAYRHAQHWRRAETALQAVDPDKLDLLADWFDTDDASHGPGRDVEVQADLRRWARTIRTALTPQETP